MRSVFPRLVTVLALAVTAFVLPERASANPVPHVARGGAQFTTANDFVGSGNATHLGNYTEVGNVAFTGTGDPNVLAVSGWTVYTAADGSELWAHVDGTLNTSTGAVAATITYTGGLGRFVGATGSSSLVGQMLGGGALQVAVTGNIDF
jgi:hypothetical protein